MQSEAGKNVVFYGSGIVRRENVRILYFYSN